MNYFSDFFSVVIGFAIWFWLILVVIDGVLGLKDYFHFDKKI